MGPRSKDNPQAAKHSVSARASHFYHISGNALNKCTASPLEVQEQFSNEHTQHNFCINKHGIGRWGFRSRVCAVMVLLFAINQHLAGDAGY